MFNKSGQTKHNVSLKGSGVKRLRDRLVVEFPNADLDLLIPPKSTVGHIKYETHSQAIINIYTVDKQPRFFETEENRLVPTVFTLWLVRDLLPYFTTHQDVMPKLVNGADLMIPGVVPVGVGRNMFGRFKQNQLVAINFKSNEAAAGVGYLPRSSDDLYMMGGRGVAVKILHLYGDKLWNLEPTKVNHLPMFSPSPLTAEDFPALGEQRSSTSKVPGSYAAVSAELKSEAIENVTVDMNSLEIQSEESADGPVGNEKEHLDDDAAPEDLLKTAFLTAIKKNGKTLQLPLLTSNFYRCQVVPESLEKIDLKKTKYKKLSAFLDEMQNQGFIKVREESKGVDKIVSIDFTHPEIVNFVVDIDKPKPDADDTTQEQPLFKTQLTEMYIITNETAAFFAKVFLKRGEEVPVMQLKKIVREYISNQKLPTVHGTDKKIELDETLRAVCGCQQATTSEICQVLKNKMQHSFQMCAPKDSTSNKPRIQMSLATRSGNKKVTLVSNLECYGIILSEFIKLCKVGAAASTTIVKLPHQNSEQLQIQGNQIAFIFKLLTETYKVSPKNILGLELQKTTKKKKTKK